MLTGFLFVFPALSGAIQDKSPVVAKLMATSLARLVALAPEATLVKLIAHLQKIYLETEDPDIKNISGVTMLEIARQAIEALKKCTTEATPLVFFGMHDEDENVQKIWSEIWEDLTQGMALGLRQNLSEIITFLIKALETQSWLTRKQAAISLSTAVTTLEKSRESQEIFLPLAPQTLAKLVDILAGRTWKGKEAVLQALTDVCVCSKPLLTKENASGPSLQVLLELFLREAAKKDKDYRRKSLECLGKFVNTFELSALDKTFPIFLDVIQPKEGEDSGGEDAESGRRPLQVLVLASAYRGLGLTWPKADIPPSKLFFSFFF